MWCRSGNPSTNLSKMDLPVFRSYDEERHYQKTIWLLPAGLLRCRDSITASLAI